MSNPPLPTHSKIGTEIQGEYKKHIFVQFVNGDVKQYSPVQLRKLTEMKLRPVIIKIRSLRGCA